MSDALQALGCITGRDTHDFSNIDKFTFHRNGCILVDRRADYDFSGLSGACFTDPDALDVLCMKTRKNDGYKAIIAEKLPYGILARSPLQIALR